MEVLQEGQWRTGRWGREGCEEGAREGVQQGHGRLCWWAGEGV